MRGKQQDKSITGSATNDRNGCYSSQLPGLYDGPSGIMDIENTGPSTAVDIRTAVQQVITVGC